METSSNTTTKNKRYGRTDIFICRNRLHGNIVDEHSSSRRKKNIYIYRKAMLRAMGIMIIRIFAELQTICSNRFNTHTHTHEYNSRMNKNGGKSIMEIMIRSIKMGRVDSFTC